MLTATVIESPPELTGTSPGNSEVAIAAHIRSLLNNRYQFTVSANRRQQTRYPFPYLVWITPLENGCNPADKTIVVVGKQLSEEGIDFYHQHPLPYRRAIVSLPTHNDKWVSFLTDLSWCRFTGFGWYSNGGRFLKKIDNPLTDSNCPFEPDSPDPLERYNNELY